MTTQTDFAARRTQLAARLASAQADRTAAEEAIAATHTDALAADQPTPDTSKLAAKVVNLDADIRAYHAATTALDAEEEQAGETAAADAKAATEKALAPALVQLEKAGGEVADGVLALAATVQAAQAIEDKAAAVAAQLHLTLRGATIASRLDLALIEHGLRSARELGSLDRGSGHDRAERSIASLREPRTTRPIPPDSGMMWPKAKATDRDPIAEPVH